MTGQKLTKNKAEVVMKFVEALKWHTNVEVSVDIDAFAKDYISGEYRAEPYHKVVLPLEKKESGCCPHPEAPRLSNLKIKDFEVSNEPSTFWKKFFGALGRRG